ncbi:MAG TPA: DUF899 family protein, partial [Actinoplanes sp.]
MRVPEIVTEEEWLEARRALLAREKELTRLRDAVAAERRSLPMVEVTSPSRRSCGPTAGCTTPT